MMRADAFVITLAVLTGAGLAGCSNPPRQEPVPDNEFVVPVGAQRVETGDISAVIHATGIVTPAPGAEFLAVAPEPALIADVPRAEGERVTSGDILVRFEIAAANQQVSRQRAEVERAQLLLENARVAQTRARELFERGIISRREMESADREVADAQAAVAQSDATRAAAEAAIARSTVRAPFSGVIAQRLHNPGDFVRGTATDPVLRLIDPARLEVTATIKAADAPRVLPGRPARLATVTGTVPVRLAVVSRPEAATPGAANAGVRLAFVDSTTLPVDTPIEVDIDAEERVNVVLIPPDALVREGAETAVFVASGTTAVRRIVTTGLANADRVEITSGLKPGELLITRGHTGLEDGAVISVDLATNP
jgi:RND family efflux transporter MFP subunit